MKLLSWQEVIDLGRSGAFWQGVLSISSSTYGVQGLAIEQETGIDMNLRII